MEFQVGDVVCSKAGRDEGTFLVVVGIEGGYLYCATESRGRLNGQSEKSAASGMDQPPYRSANDGNQSCITQGAAQPRGSGRSSCHKREVKLCRNRI